MYENTYVYVYLNTYVYVYFSGQLPFEGKSLLYYYNNVMYVNKNN